MVIFQMECVHSRIQECWCSLPFKAHIFLLLTSYAQKYSFNIVNNQVIELILDLFKKNYSVYMNAITTYDCKCTILYRRINPYFNKIKMQINERTKWQESLMFQASFYPMCQPRRRSMMLWNYVYMQCLNDKFCFEFESSSHTN